MVALQLYHLVLIFCIVQYRRIRVAELQTNHPDWSEAEVGRAVPQLGIALLWGNKEKLIKNDEIVTWEVDRPRRGKGRVAVPGGAVNAFIIDNNLGSPLIYHEQFYRLAERLEAARWLLGGEYRFVYRDQAERFVVNYLMWIPIPDWPTYVPVENGVPLLNDIQPKLPTELLSDTIR